jgi:uncharacterized membrane protein YciS (DUF1049 family)
MTNRYDVLIAQYAQRDSILTTMFFIALSLVVAWIIIDRGFIKSRVRSFLRTLIPGLILILIAMTLMYRVQ